MPHVGLRARETIALVDEAGIGFTARPSYPTTMNGGSGRVMLVRPGSL